LLGRIREGLDQPDLFDPPALDRWLRSCGVASVEELVTTSGRTGRGATVTIGFGPDDSVATRTRFPVAAALLVRGPEVSVAALLQDTRRVAAHLDRIGFVAPPIAGFRNRRSVLVVWVVPDTLFDDPDWPGAQGSPSPDQARAQRRAFAGSWLAREGVGLLVSPP
ncbi:MAG: hypothetical protein ABMB14_31520, partial [Myxococcota bacterium]